MAIESREVQGLERVLRLRDHIDYQEVLRQQLLKVQRAFETLDIEIIQASISALLAQTPIAWYDNKWEEDRKSSQYPIDVDIRPKCCGIPLEKEYCLANNIPISREIVFVDPVKRLQAIVNLWDRKGYTSRRQVWEESTGIPYDEYMKFLSERHMLEDDEPGELQKPDQVKEDGQ